MTARAAVERSLERIAADGRTGIWIELVEPIDAMARAARIDEQVSSGRDLPLAGLTLAVKGNIDVAGYRTTAGCPTFGTVAVESAPVVAALEAAGAVVMGITNLDQFATGLVGTRSPYGICPNSQWPGFISGGSSSGSAVAVAADLVDIALGTDTAGSGRVPAAANGIVGLKPTRGRCSTQGVVPACASLDCVSFFARTVELAGLLARIAASTPVVSSDPWRRRPRARSGGSTDRIRVGSPETDSLVFAGRSAGLPEFLEAQQVVIDSFDRPVELVPIDLNPFVRTGELLYEGSFVAERFAAVGDFVLARPDGLDPVVASLVEQAGELAGWQVFRDFERLEQARRATEEVWSTIDCLLVPSVPRLPTVADVQADPVGVNAMLGTYTNFVNLLDLAAITIPVGEALESSPPTSITLIGPAWSDEELVDLASQTMSASRRHR